MGYFKLDAVVELKGGLSTAIEKNLDVKIQLLHHPFKQQRAFEFAVHGICRRFDTLKHCCERVYELLPPDLEELPESETVKEATIHIQAFVSNVVGVLDNLAWVWISERELTHQDGRDFLPKEVKLSRDCRDLWRDLPLAFRQQVVEFRPWFEHISDWRDALLHRIPLYIPPFSVRDIDAYNQLEQAGYLALKEGDLDKHGAISEELEEMKFFAPLIMHSFSENPQPAVFHPNLIADMNTVSDLVSHLLKCIADLQNT